MPQIPTAPLPDVIKRPMESPEAEAAPWKTFAQVGEAISGVSDLAFKASRRIQDAEDRVKLLKSENEINGDIDRSLEEISMRTDYDAFPDYFDQKSSELKQKYEAAYSKNPRIWDAVSTGLDTKLEGLRHTIEGRRIKLLNDDGQMQITMAQDEAVLNMSRETDKNKKDLIRGEFVLKLTDFADHHIITKDQQYKILKDLDVKVQKTQILEGLKSTEPAIIQKTLDDYKKGEFAELEQHDPVWLTNHIEDTKKALETAKTEKKKTMDKMAVNSALGYIENNYISRGDFAGARRQMNDVLFQKDWGLIDAEGNPDEERISKMRTAINARETDYNKDREDKDSKLYNEATKLIVNGKLSQANQLIMSEDFPAQHREALSNWITRLNKEEANEKDSLAKYADLTDYIDASEDPQDSIDKIIKTPGLSVNHAEKLIDRARTKYGAEIKDSRTRADKLINDVLAPTETLAQQVEQWLAAGETKNDPIKQDMANQVTSKKAVAGEAKEALHDWIDEQNKLHASGKRKALTSQEIWDHANQLCAFRTEPLDKQIEDIHKLQSSWKMTTHKKGDVREYQGAKYEFDGIQWVKKK